MGEVLSRRQRTRRAALRQRSTLRAASILAFENVLRELNAPSFLVEFENAQPGGGQPGAGNHAGGLIIQV